MQAFGWGMLNRYLYGHGLGLAADFPTPHRDGLRGTDEVQYIDFDTNSDKCRAQRVDR